MNKDAQVTVAKTIGIPVCRARGFLKFESAPNLGLSPTQLPSGGSSLTLDSPYVGSEIESDSRVFRLATVAFRLLGIFAITTIGVWS
jgi:hypothetical protein